jgi:VIT1/CCC1 family predicted Fe2+/Mn2+ transporter
MNYYSLLITFGVCVVLIPNLGFPGSWKIVMLSVLGCAIVLCAYFASKAVTKEKPEEIQESVLPE